MVWNRLRVRESGQAANIIGCFHIVMLGNIAQVRVLVCCAILGLLIHQNTETGCIRVKTIRAENMDAD